MRDVTVFFDEGGRPYGPAYEWAQSWPTNAHPAKYLSTTPGGWVSDSSGTFPCGCKVARGYLLNGTGHWCYKSRDFAVLCGAHEALADGRVPVAEVLGTRPEDCSLEGYLILRVNPVRKVGLEKEVREIRYAVPLIKEWRDTVSSALETRQSS